MSFECSIIKEYKGKIFSQKNRWVDTPNATECQQRMFLELLNAHRFHENRFNLVQPLTLALKNIIFIFYSKYTCFMFIKLYSSTLSTLMYFILSFKPLFIFVCFMGIFHIIFESFLKPMFCSVFSVSKIVQN